MDFRCTNGSASVALKCNPKVVVLALLQKSVTLKCNTKSVTLKVQPYSRSARRRNELFYTRSGKLFRFSDAFYRALVKEALYCHCSYYTGRIFFNEVWKIAAQHSMQKFVFYYELEGLSCFPYICEC